MKRSKSGLIHTVRVVMLLCIAGLIRSEHQNVVRRSEQVTIELDLAKSVFPSAFALVASSHDDRLDVLDQAGAKLGYVLQTSPASDSIIGFSGSTNVMVAFGPDDRIVGMRVISSGDTRDHLRQVTDDTAFMRHLDKRERSEVASVKCDAVSGATLTSLAIREAVIVRLGEATKLTSLRFPDPPDWAAVELLFEEAETISPVDGEPVYQVYSKAGSEIGWILRTSPDADDVVGYQGPSDAVVGFDPDGTVLGIALATTFDNEPYVNYVREDRYFRKTFDGLPLAELAEIDLYEMQVEGVSGATMTSMAVAEGVIAAAKQQQQRLQDSRGQPLESQSNWRPSTHDVGTLLVVVAGAVIGLTRLRGHRVIGRVWKVTLVVYLGLTAGNLVSQAMLVGWAKNGVPIKNAFGLFCLTVAALVLPVITKRNIYCTHLCPHGALQQLVKPTGRRRIRLSGKLRAALSLVPIALLLWCGVVGILGLGFSLVDIEPFDAYVFRIAGVATLVIAVVGIVAAFFVPMAYCRYGCPTGALLEFLRFNARSDQWSGRDWVAAGFLVLALGMTLWA